MDRRENRRWAAFVSVLWLLPACSETGDQRPLVAANPLVFVPAPPVLPTNAAPGDAFGSAVAASGETVVVGAPLANGGSAQSGNAYVFVRDPSGWTEQAELGDSSLGTGAGVGSAVAIDGDTVLVGAPDYGNASEPQTGRGATVFERTGGAWSELTALTFSSGFLDPERRLGASVSVSGDLALVGAPYTNATGSARGMVVAYELSAGAWRGVAPVLLAAPGADLDQFGAAVAIDATNAVVGAPGAGSGFGAAYVFQYAGSWSQTAEFPGILTGYGAAAAISGLTAVVGTAGLGNSAQLLADSGSGWTTGAYLPGADTNFGAAVAVHGTLALVGAPGYGGDVGRAFLFDLTGGAPTELAVFENSAGLSGDRFGAAVALSDTLAVIGAPGADVNGTDAGAVYVYDMVESYAGAPCTDPANCDSGFCVDGFCCDTACTGACQACAAALQTSGADGTCGPSLAGTDPHDDCAPDPGYPDNCQADGLCDGAGACRAVASAGTLCGASTCVGTELGTAACNAVGACADATLTNCGAYVCRGNACPSDCTSDAHCAAGYRCDASGACVPFSPLGASCSADATCASELCVDGVCCESECTGQCEACDAAGSEGSCVLIFGAPHGAREPCIGDGLGCGGICDQASTTCAYPEGTTCGLSSCQAGETISASCDGAGTCEVNETQSCGTYACDADGIACVTECLSNADCAPGHVCDQVERRGECLPLAGACQGDGTYITLWGNHFDCTPYRCDEEGCPESCTSDNECLDGYACNAEHACVEAPPAGPAEAPCLCTAAGRRARSTNAGLALWLLGLIGCWSRRVGARTISNEP